ncbi:MAG: site-specific integrase [Colwellia sp.]|nr:site-specific integrase [Colwellia sp.]
MASITKRGNGKWQVKIRKKGFSTQSKTFAKKVDAERWASLIISNMDKGIFESTNVAENTLVTDIFDRYWDEVVQYQKSADGTKYVINKMKLILGHLRFINLSVEIVREYKEYRLESVSGETVRKEILLISRMIKHAIQEWQIYLPKGNPATIITLPKKSKARDRRLIGNEKSILLAEASNYGGEISDIIELAIETAMRRGEIVKLEWKHFNPVNRTILIPDTKNEDDRDVPLSTRATEILLKQPKTSQYIFNIRGDSIGQAFRRITKRANIKNLRFHDLRHEGTTLLFEQNFQLMEVSAITGHKDLSMLKRYTHLRAEDLAQKMR